ncbi:MAG: L,D-transpeptidase family protein [Candidatus Omnitrophica bacterium]|nr:L,D-transpeptidase family protein [Candidatus Omnitrophota bacterium]
MNRRIIITVLAVIAIVTLIRLSGCGKKKEAPKNEPVQKTELVLNEAVTLSKKSPEKAIEAFENIVSEFPESVQAQKALVKIAEFYNKNDELLLEKESLQKLINTYPQGDFTSDAVARVGEINIKILFSKAQTKNSIIYEVKPGDSLYKIAKQYNTNVEFIMKVNSLKNSLIRPGMKVKIITSVFKILVSKSELVLKLSADDEVIKVYPIGIGKDNSTPVGQFRIVNRIVDPVWYKTGAIVPAGSAENILGPRWLGISEPGYGIHGTVDKQPIQQQKTQGCVRMMNKDVEELFDIVPVNTEVIINE